MMSDNSDFITTATEVKTRGYWDLSIHPTEFLATRIPFEILEPLIRATAVSRPNWGQFPAIDAETQNNRIIRGNDWVGGSFSWDLIREVWKFYQSGQFHQHVGLFYDWKDKSRILPCSPGWSFDTHFPVGQVLAQISYFFEFANRLSARLADHNQGAFRIEVAFKHLANRLLIVDDPRRTPFLTRYEGPSEDVLLQRDYTAVELVSNWETLALEYAKVLFSRFGWNPSPAMLAEIQASVY